MTPLKSPDFVSRPWLNSASFKILSKLHEILGSAQQPTTSASWPDFVEAKILALLNAKTVTWQIIPILVDLMTGADNFRGNQLLLGKILFWLLTFGSCYRNLGVPYNPKNPAFLCWSRPTSFWTISWSRARGPVNITHLLPGAIIPLLAGDETLYICNYNHIWLTW